MLSPMPPRPRVHELRVPNLADFNFPALGAGRLARLQTMMKRHDLPVALLYTMANIRYATGVNVMVVWTAGTFARYCLVPAEGTPILFEYSGSMHVSQKVIEDVRPAYTWRFGGTAERDKAREWAQSIRSALKERGLERESFKEFADKALRLPAAYEAQRYPTMVHQAGLEDEGPGIPYPDDPRGGQADHAGPRAAGEHGAVPGVLRRQAGRAVRREAGGPGARHQERRETHLHVSLRGEAARLRPHPP